MDWATRGTGVRAELDSWSPMEHPSRQGQLFPGASGEQVEGGKEQRWFGKLWKLLCGAVTLASHVVWARRIPVSWCLCACVVV